MGCYLAHDNTSTIESVVAGLKDRPRGAELLVAGVVVGEVTSQDVPPPLPRRQLEANSIRPKLLDGLHREIRCRPVEHCHSAAVSAWRVCSEDALPSRPAGVDSISYLGFLKDSQVHVGLVYPPQRQPQSPVSSVPNVIGAEPNRHPPPCIIPGTPTHPLPTDTFLSPDPAALPAHA